MPINIKPYTIAKLASEFTSEGLPLLKLIETNVPSKKGTPYLFKATIDKKGKPVSVHKMAYTDKPELYGQKLHRSWSLDGLYQIIQHSYENISHGEAALIEIVERLINEKCPVS